MKYSYNNGEAIKHCIIALIKQVLPIFCIPLNENRSYIVFLLDNYFLLLSIRVYYSIDKSSILVSI